MKRIKTILVVYLLTIIILLIPINHNVKAIVDGDYYLCNFQDHPIDTKDLSEKINGVEWLYVEGKSTVEGKGVGVSDENGGSSDYDYCIANWYAPSWTYMNDAWFNLSRNTREICYNFDAESSQSARWNVNKYFRRSNGDQVLRIYAIDPADSGVSQCDWYVYNSDNVLKGSYDADTAGHFWVNVTLNTTTQEVNVNISKTASSVMIDVWFSCSNFDYISSIFMDVTQVEHYAWELFVDDFKINAADPGPVYLWEIDESSRGCVDCDYDGSTTHTITAADPIVFETDCKFWTLGEQVYQVALSVHEDTDLGDLAVWLRIGDTYLEEYDQYYTYDDLYVMVWENVNTSVYETEVPFEFKFVAAASKTLKVVWINDDVDSDSDRYHKYSLDDDNFNGLYDGDIHKNRDLCYMVWYGPGAAFGDLNVSVFNESYPNEPLVNWSIQIVNKITGFIEYNATGLTNPTVIVAQEYGLGERLIYISNESFYTRIYYVDVENYVNYTLTAYLPYIDVSELYVIQALDNDTGSPIKDVFIQITKFFGMEISEIASGFTNAYGLFYVYLIPETSYYANLSKNGYESLEVEHFIPDPDKYGIEYPIIFYLIPEEDNETEIPDIELDILVLSAYNDTTMQIYYRNLNDDNAYVQFVCYDFIGSQALKTWNISTYPNNITLYFTWADYNLSGDILQVTAEAYRINGSVYITTRYFNIHQKPPGSDVIGSAAIGAILSISIVLFGITMIHPKKVMGVIGMIIMVIGLAITVIVTQTWYIHLIQAIEVILLIFVILVFREEGIHAV